MVNVIQKLASFVYFLYRALPNPIFHLLNFVALLFVILLVYHFVRSWLT